MCSPDRRRLNALKNREVAAGPEAIDPRVTLVTLLAPGDRGDRWDVTQAAATSGYVYNVQRGAIETASRRVQSVARRDSHIELTVDPMENVPTERVIVEGTPSLAYHNAGQEPQLIHGGSASGVVRPPHEGDGLDAV
jgi:hypothetical protein